LAAKRRIEAAIDEEERRLLAERAKRAEELHAAEHPKWSAASPELQRWYQFLGYDPDNPDVPLD
jgi:hypothetical protein